MRVLTVAGDSRRKRRGHQRDVERRRRRPVGRCLVSLVRFIRDDVDFLIFKHGLREGRPNGCFARGRIPTAELASWRLPIMKPADRRLQPTAVGGIMRPPPLKRGRWPDQSIERRR